MRSGILSSVCSSQMAWKASTMTAARLWEETKGGVVCWREDGQEGLTGGNESLAALD